MPSASTSKRLTELPRYQFNPHLSRDDIITAILIKSLTVAPSPDFSLALHLLPPAILNPPPRSTSPLAQAVARLNDLNNLLSAAEYASFWRALRADSLYADLTAEVAGFEELMRVRIAAVVSQAVREVQRSVAEGWLELKGEAFERFIGVCGWTIEGDAVRVPVNKENEAKGTVVRENVKFDRKSNFHLLVVACKNLC